MDPRGTGTWAGHSPAGARDEWFAGRYRLSDLIGTGGMGAVWRAQDAVLGRVVAVKVLHREYAADPVARSRFRAEARAAASISHPHVVSVFDYGDGGARDDEERPFLVMELVDGWSLAQELATRGSLPAEEVARVVEEIALGLSAAHERHLVHRDIKPGNLLVTPARTIKITDFGIARAADSASLTRTGTVVGTAQYISPEQAAGHRAGPESDIYSLGAVAYACLSGAPPFRGGTPLATALAHLRDPVPPLSIATPAALRELVMSMLAKNPGDRPHGSIEVATLARGAVPGTTRTGTAVTPIGSSRVSDRPPAQEMSPLAPTAVLPAGSDTGWQPPGPRGAARAKRVAVRHPVILVLLILVAAVLSGIILSLPSPPTQRLPSVVGDPVATARAALEHVGLAAAFRAADGPEAAGYVLSQSPSAGRRLGRGHLVELTVSSGFVQISDSTYAGRPFDVVAAELSAVGLHPAESYVTSESISGQVLTISPQGRVPLGSVVHVEVTAVPPPAPSQPSPSGEGSGARSGHRHPKPGD